jgi:hypothetical protein
MMGSHPSQNDELQSNHAIGLRSHQSHIQAYVQDKVGNVTGVLGQWAVTVDKVLRGRSGKNL